MQENEGFNEKTETLLDQQTPMTFPSQSVLANFRNMLMFVLSRFWRLCATGMFFLFLFYWIYGGYVALTLLLFTIIGLGYNAQDRLLYFPNQPPNSNIYVERPSALQMPYENHFVNTSDGVRINLVLIKQKQNHSSAPTIIYFHGNAGNIGHRLMNALGFHSVCGVNLLLVEYRGYGHSQGSPSESGLYRDSEAAMDFLLRRSDIDHNKLLLFGRSLGGAVAIYLASLPYYEQHIRCLLIENTFTSLPSIGRRLFNFPILKFIPNWFFKNQYPSLRRIKKITCPTIVISGMSDNLIPPTMMQALYDASASDMKRIARFEAGQHNDTWTCQNYYGVISFYIKQVLSNTHSSTHPSHGVTDL